MASEVTLAEAVELGAVDPNFFGRFFFPKACRQDAPDFHQELDEALDSEDDRYVNAMIARGFAKTTKLRVYIGRRIAYRISRTIIVVGKSQEAAVKTLEWVKRAVQNNDLYAGAFGLSKGAKWADSDMEVIATTYNERGEVIETIAIRLLALGITGSVRGINIDDFRPDLIVVDDPCDEENTATAEQRKKMSDLFFGALAKTLAPKVDSPFAKMVLLQTVLNKEDLVSICDKDPQWRSLKFSCFKRGETGQIESRWPERFPLKDLLEEKDAHIHRNQLPLWLREMECKVTSEETSAFLERWLQYWDEGSLPKGGKRCLAVDPTPPPKDGQPSLNPKLDDAVVMAVQMTGGKFYILEIYATKSPDPDEFLSQIFTMARKWKIKLSGFETVLFQRVLAHIFKNRMREERYWLTLKYVEDRRNKRLRIIQDISGVANAGDLYIRPEMLDFIAQFIEFPDSNHDDMLDALSIAINTLKQYNVLAEDDDDWLEGEYEILDPEDPHGELEWQRGAP